MKKAVEHSSTVPHKYASIKLDYMHLSQVPSHIVDVYYCCSFAKKFDFVVVGDTV